VMESILGNQWQMMGLGAILFLAITNGWTLFYDKLWLQTKKVELTEAEIEAAIEPNDHHIRTEEESKKVDEFTRWFDSVKASERGRMHKEAENDSKV
jgi:hypothetical protein